MLQYADMTCDPHDAIRRIAAHLSIDADRGTVDAIVETPSFSNMKAAAGRFAPHAAAGIYHDPSAFFDSGASRKWEGQLDAERIARFEATLSAMLDPTMADWLMWGDGPVGRRPCEAIAGSLRPGPAHDREDARGGASASARHGRTHALPG